MTASTLDSCLLIPRLVCQNFTTFRLLFLAVLSHSLNGVRIKGFVTVNFASLCLKSK